VRDLNVALIGYAFMGKAHSNAWRQVTSFFAPRLRPRLKVLCGRTASEVQQAARTYGWEETTTDWRAVIDRPDVDLIDISTPDESHAEIAIAAAKAGKAVFCEKPMGLTLAEADRGITATATAGVALQVGFNRRFATDFAAGHQLVVDGAIGTPQLMRSLTRDPGLANPAAVPPWTIFLQTLIHDFDTLLWLNPGAEPETVYATADALVAPEFKAGGLLDTAAVVITFDNGAIAVAEASFSAAYGYDVRGEVFGSAGMVSMGGGPKSPLVHSSARGRHIDTVRGDVELFLDAYTAEFVEFTDAVREGRRPAVTGDDARRALAVALACVESVQTGAPVRVDGGTAR